MLWIELERQRCATPLLRLSDAWTHSASVDSYRAVEEREAHGLACGAGGAHRQRIERSLSAWTCY